jgi:hypothetical protein
MTLDWATTDVPGSLTVTGDSADSASHPAGNGRCSRCERMLPECGCPGVTGEVQPAPGD